MVAPEKIANGDHNIFICGNDNEARQKVIASFCMKILTGKKKILLIWEI